MVRLTAETGDIHQKAMTVQQEAGEIEALLAKLTAAMTDLHNTWQGTAASAFQELYASWSTQARSMRETLESIGRSLNAAGTDYEQLETQIASQLR
jgi:WXG100 family type VII secretion target